MTVFVLASLAVVLVLVALALRPLWSGARRSALALALALGAGTGGLYLLLGTPDALDPAQVKAPETLEEAIVQLERRLADEPGSSSSAWPPGFFRVGSCTPRWASP